MNGTNIKKYVAELLGTFVLIFAGLGTAVLAEKSIGLIGIAFAFGLALLAMVYTIGPLSGCHINPAVTFGFLVAKRISAKDAAGYMIAQIAGAILGSAAVLMIAHGAPAGYDAHLSGLGANGYAMHSPNGYSLSAAFIVEIVLSFVFVLTVLGATDKKAPAGFAGIAIGLALTLVHLVAIPVTNTSVNPARSIGPAVFVGGWALQQLWLFVLAPLGGGALAAMCYTALLSKGTPAPVPDKA